MKCVASVTVGTVAVAVGAVVVAVVVAVGIVVVTVVVDKITADSDECSVVGLNNVMRCIVFGIMLPWMNMGTQFSQGAIKPDDTIVNGMFERVTARVKGERGIPDFEVAGVDAARKKELFIVNIL